MFIIEVIKIYYLHFLLLFNVHFTLLGLDKLDNHWFNLFACSAAAQTHYQNQCKFN